MTKTTLFVGNQGAGKSSLALNAMFALDELLIDSNLGRHGYPVHLLDATPEGTITRSLDQPIQATTVPLQKGDLQAKYITSSRRPNAGRKYVAHLAKQGGYEVLYVDSSSEYPKQVNDLMKSADGIILVTTAGEDVSDWFHFLERAHKANPKMTLDKLLINRYDPDNYVHREFTLGQAGSTGEQVTAIDVLAVPGEGFHSEDYVFTFPDAEEEFNQSYSQRTPAYVMHPGMRSTFKELIRSIRSGTTISKPHRRINPLPIEDMLRYVDEKLYQKIFEAA